MKTVGVILSLALVGALSLSACSNQDPCATLPAPSAVEIAAANSGAEIEREVGGVECELINGRWVRDGESSSRRSSQYGSSSKTTTPARTTVKQTTAPTTPATVKKTLVKK